MTRSRVCAALVSRKSRGYSQHNGLWIVLVAAPVQPARAGDHIAFGSTPEVIEATAAKLQAMGREFIRARSNRSLYFFDYDDHVFELDSEGAPSAHPPEPASHREADYGWHARIWFLSASATGVPCPGTSAIHSPMRVVARASPYCALAY